MGTVFSLGGFFLPLKRLRLNCAVQLISCMVRRILRVFSSPHQTLPLSSMLDIIVLEHPPFPSASLQTPAHAVCLFTLCWTWCCSWWVKSNKASRRSDLRLEKARWWNSSLVLCHGELFIQMGLCSPAPAVPSLASSPLEVHTSCTSASRAFPPGAALRIRDCFTVIWREKPVFVFLPGAQHSSWAGLVFLVSSQYQLYQPDESWTPAFPKRVTTSWARALCQLAGTAQNTATSSSSLSHKHIEHLSILLLLYFHTPVAHNDARNGTGCSRASVYMSVYVPVYERWDKHSSCFWIV